MLSNYTGLIEQRHLASLRMVRQAESYATDLLALQPDASDAYLALGAPNYIIGCLLAYQRFFLWFGGIHGDRNAGLAQLKITATRGHYLRPYARILLALAAEREKQIALARAQLEELVSEFPENPLFTSELALLKKSSGVSGSP